MTSLDQTWEYLKVIRDERSTMSFGSGLATSFAKSLGSAAAHRMTSSTVVIQVEPYMMDVNSALLKGLEGRTSEAQREVLAKIGRAGMENF